MARRGIDGASFKQIQADVGARNRSAVNHYFGNRPGVIAAILAKHREGVNARRHELLDESEAAGEKSATELAKALVLPLLECLETESGLDFAVVAGEAMARFGPTRLFDADEYDYVDGYARAVKQLGATVAGSPAARKVRVAQATLATAVLVGDIARDVNAGALSLNQAKRRLRGLVEPITAMLEI